MLDSALRCYYQTQGREEKRLFQPRLVKHRSSARSLFRVNMVRPQIPIPFFVRHSNVLRRFRVDPTSMRRFPVAPPKTVSLTQVETLHDDGAVHTLS